MMNLIFYVILMYILKDEFVDPKIRTEVSEEGLTVYIPEFSEEELLGLLEAWKKYQLVRLDLSSEAV